MRLTMRPEAKKRRPTGTTTAAAAIAMAAVCVCECVSDRNSGNFNEERKTE
jgi:hypothetical protein